MEAEVQRDLSWEEEMKPNIVAEEGKSEQDIEVVVEAGQNDAVKEEVAGSVGLPAEKLNYSSNRTTSMTSSGLNAVTMPLTQLTMFYGGNVSVFDGIPPEKAREIMLLAFAAAESAETKIVAGSVPAVSPALMRSPSFCRLQADVPIARRHSLQRFLEKRRDRLLSKNPYHAPSTNRKIDEATNLGASVSSDATLEGN